MSNKMLLELGYPIIQGRAAIVELSYLGRTVGPLPKVIDFEAVKLMHGASVPELVNSIRPAGKWPGSYSGPIEETLQEVA